MSAAKVKLGDHEYQVVPQRIGYLQKKLGAAVGELGGADDVADVIAGRNDLVGSGYQLLAVFIPDLMPEHEFAGYASPQAYAQDEWVEAADRSPNPDEVYTAFETALRVNRLDVVRHLGKIVPPDLIRGLLQKGIGDSISTLLLSSPAESGDSASRTPSLRSPAPASSANAD